jgi:UDP-N-acetylglucosamine 4,6-dehydratase/5-epimerase
MSKCYLITGGTGSFGKAFIKKIISNKEIGRIVIFSRDEAKQFYMSQEFNGNSKLRFFLGDIRDPERVQRAMKGIDVVVHAAALKQVPAAEYNPTEFIKTNIIGAENIIKASIELKTKKIIALSTDKASSPINLYGATKLVSDKLFTTANNILGSQDTKFSVVRYGNVINSRGSVIPFFRDLVNKGKKTMPITHKEMTRFLITLPQGVDFVLQCLKIMKGGEIFIPKIPSCKIIDVVKAIDKGLNLKIIGIRPGEKIHEQLFSADESNKCVEFKNFYIIEPNFTINRKLKFNKIGNLKGKKVDKNFEYNSCNNKKKLSIKEIKKLINE